MNGWNELWEYALVFLLGAIPWVEIAVVIPLSIVAGLNAPLVAILAFLGNLSTVWLLVVFFDRVRQWMDRKKGEGAEASKSKRRERAVHIWNKYGLPGLSLLGPLLIGSHIAVFIAILFGGRKSRALLWMTISLAVWTALFAVVSVYGIDLLGIRTLRGA